VTTTFLYPYLRSKEQHSLLSCRKIKKYIHMAQDSLHSVAVKGFNCQTDLYEKARPTYPSEALDYISSNILHLSHEEPKKEVVELGSGTGKFTRLLLAQGAHITAVEPVKGMREKFNQILPDVPILEGSADSIPLSNSSADAVIAAQAFHWFATISAIKEIHRVLKPGGIFFCIWNLMDDSDKWASLFREEVESHEHGVPQYRHMNWRDVFELDEARAIYELPLQEKFFKWYHHDCDEDILWGTALSKSYIASQTPIEQEQIKKKLHHILATELPSSFGPEGSRKVDIPYNTHIIWCKKKKD